MYSSLTRLGEYSATAVRSVRVRSLPVDAPAVLAFADRFFGAIEAGDLEIVRSCYDSEATIWHNFDGVDQTVDANLATLGWLVSRLFDRNYDIVRREVLADGLFQQHVLRGVTHRGEPFALAAAMMLHLSGEPLRIGRLEEYLDPAGAAALR